MPPGRADISEEVLEEGCYYLSEMGMTLDEVARKFEIEEAAAAGFRAAFVERLRKGEVSLLGVDRAFWDDVKREAEGDVKLTFVSEKGFHHAWKSELARLDGRALMSIFESSRDFLSTDLNERFLSFPPPKGYDPLALDREVSKAVGTLSKLLEDKWESERKKESDTAGPSNRDPPDIAPS